jgi:hypothetical protein
MLRWHIPVTGSKGFLRGLVRTKHKIKRIMGQHKIMGQRGVPLFHPMTKIEPNTTSNG